MSVAVEFVLTLESPLFIGTHRQARASSCLDHVPGSTLRGALLATLYRERGSDDDTFAALLSSSSNRFPFLAPGPSGTSPVPRSVVGCKRGCPDHKLDDLLVDCYLARRDQSPEAFDALSRRHGCRACGEDNRPVDGWWHDGGRLKPVVRMQRLCVGIDRQTGTASRGVLFGTTSVAPTDGEGGPTTLTGVGELEASALEALEPLCRSPLFLGKYKSRGFGRARLELRRLDQDASKQSYGIEKGCRALNKATGEREVFTLDLVSPLIHWDRYLRASLDPADWLPPELSATVLDQVVASTVISGWDLAAGMPKDEEHALAPGSVVLARSDLPRAELVERLVALERTGLGERRGEGFGQVVVNHRQRIDRL